MQILYNKGNPNRICTVYWARIDQVSLNELIGRWMVECAVNFGQYIQKNKAAYSEIYKVFFFFI